MRDVTPCARGTVAAQAGAPVDVLTINGSAGVVSVAPRTPISIALAASPQGPARARYVVWIWSEFPEAQRRVSFLGQTLGCTVNPTPLFRTGAPLPIACLRGRGMPRLACRGTTELTAPNRAPWAITSARGLPHGSVFTMQGILEDLGASNALGHSITNAVILAVP